MSPLWSDTVGNQRDGGAGEGLQSPLPEVLKHVADKHGAGPAWGKARWLLEGSGIPGEQGLFSLGKQRMTHGCL